MMQILTSKGFPESLIFPRITPTMKERNFHGISRTLSFVLGYSNILTKSSMIDVGWAEHYSTMKKQIMQVTAPVG